MCAIRVQATILTLVLFHSALGAFGAEPRIPLPKSSAALLPSPETELQVKFMDALKVRAAGGTLFSDAGADLSAVLALKDEYGLVFSPLIGLPQTTLIALEDNATQNSSFEQPDLGGMILVVGSPTTIGAAATELFALAETESVEFVPIGTEPPQCADLPPQTPDYLSSAFGYHGNDPGVGVFCAWTFGGRGLGIQITDCEYGFRWIPDASEPIHEDLCDVLADDPATCLHHFADHGVQTLGVLRAADNGYGWTGLAPDATLRFSSESAYCNATRQGAIARAIAASSVGDVIVLEMQTFVSSPSLQPPFLGPAEVDASPYLLTRLAVDSGLVVVAAAGNGYRSLDRTDFPRLSAYQNRGDSGAIIVGAGYPDKLHNRLEFSTFGQRVDVQGWGLSVFSLAYIPDEGVVEPDPLQVYTTSFNGTSSATAMVGGVVAAVQSLCVANNLPLRTPMQMRQLLIDTGIPQGAGTVNEHIGPFVNLPKIILALGITTNDCNLNGVPDDCDPQEDCNNNAIQDVCDIGAGTSQDCEDNLIPDECEPFNDCNQNEVRDICEIVADPFLDCYPIDGIPDGCQDTLGSCCLPDDSCQMMNSSCCYFNDGFYSGYAQCYRFACSGFGPQP